LAGREIRKRSPNRWIIVTCVFAIAGVAAVVYGGKSFLGAFFQRNQLEACLNGGSCYLSSASQLYVKAILGTVNLELAADAAVASLGICVLIASIIQVIRPQSRFLNSKSEGNITPARGSPSGPVSALPESKPTGPDRLDLPAASSTFGYWGQITYNWIADRTDYLVVILLYILLTCIFTWPLAANFTTFVNGATEDVFHELWVLHTASTAAYGPFFLFYTNSNLAPNGIILYYQVVTPFNSLVFLPISTLFGEVVAYNLLYMFTFVASAFTMYVLAYYLTKNKYAAFFAGIAFGFAPVHLGEGLAHLNIMSSEFLPLYTYFLIRTFRERNFRNPIFAAIALVLNAMCDLHFLVFGICITGVFLIYWAFVHFRATFSRAFLERFGIMAALAAIIGAVVYFQTLYGLFFAPQAQGAGLGQTPLLAAAGRRSADLLQFFVPSPQNPLFKTTTSSIYANFQSNSNVYTFMGYSVIALALIGIVASKEKRRVWLWIGLVLFGFLMALGPYVVINGKTSAIPSLWQWWYYLVPFSKAIRTP
jgi:hypothetical protein